MQVLLTLFFAYVLVSGQALADAGVDPATGAGIGVGAGVGPIGGSPVGPYGPYGPGAFGGFPTAQFFQQIVLQSEAQRILAQPGLPADLQQRVSETLSNAELGFRNCNSAAANSVLPWIQIRCITSQLQASKNALKAIEDEAQLRAIAAASAAFASPSTIANSV